VFQVHKVMVFDGDYFRRIFALLLRAGNRKDVRAYLQYKVIKSGSNYCSKVYVALML
jgi:hypothetical protein